MPPETRADFEGYERVKLKLYKKLFSYQDKSAENYFLGLMSSSNLILVP